MPITQKRQLQIRLFIPMLTLILIGCRSTQSIPSPTTTVEKDRVEATIPTDRPMGVMSQGDSALAQAPALLPEAQSDLDLLTGLTQYSIELVVNDDGYTFHGYSQVDYTNTEDVPLERLY
ncbi:MAG: hypothetical protein KAS36_06940, partial [Anaerolineales bacterium]|nr:hypothetical protein [Anaerolineales bacterium]